VAMQDQYNLIKGADPAFCQGCGCEDLRLDVTLIGAEIRMLEEPVRLQAPY
jgi:hypothetical protein